MTSPAANVTPIVSKLIEDTGERLVKIKRTGMYLDPLSITMVYAIAMAGRNTDLRANTISQGKVAIETRGKGTYTIPCQSLAEARQLADTLARLANTRAKDSARVRVQQQTDWGKSRLAGDPAYEKAKEEREEVFRYFDN
jgi:hypothetical protein